MRIYSSVISELSLVCLFCAVFFTIAVISASEAHDLQIGGSDFDFSFDEGFISFPENCAVLDNEFVSFDGIFDSAISDVDNLSKGSALNTSIGFDPAYNVTNPDYRISDSPYMRLADIENWTPIVPPEPRDVKGVEGPIAVEIYEMATGNSTIIPIDDTTQSLVETSSNSTPPFEGLLPTGVMPLTVFPPDDRAQITDTTVFPWRTICSLLITMPNGKQYFGTGAIIGIPGGHGFHVLTAGHNVHDPDDGGWADSVKVIPGLNGNYMPYYYAWAAHVRSYTAWTQDRDQRHDWALLTLDRNLGDFTGWMGRKTALSFDPIYTGWLHTAGYPGDKGMPPITMWYDADYGRSADEYNHWYYMDTYRGQSGSPVWRLEDSERYILSVHTYGDQGSGSNKGTRLNKEKYDHITTWRDEDTPPTDKADLIDDGQAYSGFSPTTITPGQNFQVWCDVRNIGTADSGGFHVSYYASTNNIISASDYLIGSDYVPSISPFLYGNSDWSGAFPSIPAGTYYVGWIIDGSGQVSEFDKTNNIAYKDSYQLVVNLPPNKPTKPSGTISGKPGVSYSYSTSATDPNGDQVKYTFDWGDGATSETGFVNSGTSASKSHTWSGEGIYDIRAKATDIHGASSGLSYALTVEMKFNTAPNKPNKPSGPSDGEPGVSYTYSTFATDADGDQVKYTFDWDDGETSETGFVNSGTSASRSHSWGGVGTYSVKAKATDTNGGVSVWSDARTVYIRSNTAPIKPSTPSGSSDGEPGVSYTYSTSTTDPEGDQVKYTFDWGDGETSNTDFVNSGTSASSSHSWSSAETYSVKAKATDPKGAVSVWSDVKTVSISQSSNPDFIGVFRPSAGTFFLDYQNNGWTAGDAVIAFGMSGDLPVAGDWDNDGIDEIGVFRPSAGTFFLDYQNDGWTSGDAVIPFGISGDLPVAGDWDNDGVDEIGVFRPSAGTFYLDYQNDGWTSGDAVIPFGISGDLPVAGDWDNDGVDEIGVFRPSAGTFYLDYENNGWTSGDASIAFGMSGDMPIASGWL